MAGRRNNNEGALGSHKRSDGRWEVRVSLPDGKRKSFYGKTKDEANKKMKQALRDIDAGLPVITDKQSVGQFLEEWLVGVKPQIGIGTWVHYRGYVYHHVLPVLGRVPLIKLTPQQVQSFYAKRIDAGLKSSTTSNIHKMLHRAFNDALQFGVVQRNVLDLVKAPRRVYREMTTLTEEQVRRFLAGVAGDRFEALYVLALTTGMREGELLGLRWQDVNLEQATLVVSVAAHMVEGRVFLAETKTAYSRRRIALSRSAIDALRRHWVCQESERLNAIAWDNSLGLVFPDSIGGLVRASTLSSWMFKRHLKRLDLPDIRFHDLCHTAATVLLSRGCILRL